MNKIYLFSISSHPNAISVNSLQIKLFKPTINFSKYDYLIITSKQVSEFLKQYDLVEYINIPALCVSVQSARSYEKLGAKVLDIGGGYGDNLVDKISAYPRDTKWLYLRAKMVASDFVQVLQNEAYSIDEIVAYESSCSDAIKKVQVENNATLIFTSPSSVKCFLLHSEINHTNRVIVIGKTTAKALPKGIEYRISKETTIDSCMKEIF